MANKILVTYASRTGATKGVAQSIAKTLIENGMDVEITPVSDVNDITQFSAVIVGSAIQSGKWLPEAIEFVQNNKEPLVQKKIASFSVCMTLAMPKSDKYRKVVNEWMNPIRTIVKPISVGLFAGVLDISKMSSISDRIKFRLSVLFGVWKEGDHRNWSAIEAWALELKDLLSRN